MVSIAAIDAGSNAIRLILGNAEASKDCQILENIREPIRLGTDVFSGGSISELTIERSVEAFVRFRQLLDAKQVRHVRAVGTSALREAENRELFVDRILAAAGIEINVIKAEEEARLIHLAVAARVDLRGQLAMLIDVGGGSIEVTLADDHNVISTESYAMGSVRLLHILNKKARGEKQFNQLVKEYVEATRQRLEREIEDRRIDCCVGTGGSLESIADVRARIFGRRDDSVSADELDEIVRRLQRLSLKQRVEELKLRPDRADVIVPASMILQKIVRQAGVKEVAIPRVGLKDGLLIDIAEDLYQTGPVKLHREQVLTSAVHLGRKFRFDEQHARSVARFACLLFDATMSLHKLDAESRLLLEAAALLHDIGHFIGASSHHKHTYYLLASTQLIGLSTAQMAMVANIARYHRKSEPKLQHEAYRGLPPRQRVVVCKLAALLRLADALDHEHAGRVKEIAVSSRRPRVTLRLKGEGDLMLEKWALASRCALFEEVFGVKLVTN